MGITGKLKQAYVAARVARHHAQAKSQFVNIDGANLHFVIKGAGQPVILIHGNPGSCYDWSGLFTPIASRYCAIAFDRPGHGHSQRPNHQPITVEVQADMLHRALSELQIERPILVGHSWGAALALAYALRCPEDLSGLVLLAPAVYKSDDGVSFLSKLPAWPVIGDVVNRLFTPLLSAWLVKSDLKKAFSPDATPKKYLSHALADWTRPRKVKWYSIDDALLLERLPHLSPHYSDIRLPVAIVTGDSDLIVPINENARRLHEALPQSQLIVLEHAGHQIPHTRPDAVMAAIDSVTARIPAKAR